MSFGIMSHLGLCRIRYSVVRDYVIWDNVAFGIMSFEIFSFWIMLFGILSDGVSNCSVYHNQSPKYSYSLVFVHESGGSLTTPVLTADR